MEGAQRVVDKARATDKKLVIGYILRVHPAWTEFIARARTLGKPLVMRMNLNQQSRGPAWNWHRNLMESLTPIVDCGVHYVDVMCQMTGAQPVRVHGIGAQLTDQTKVQNYGHLHVEFDDGSVGWYEAGWGPMMSEVAFFVKDVIGPKGCVSIVMPQEGQDHAASDDIDSHTKTNALLCHSSEIDEANNFVREDEWVDMADEPTHQELCAIASRNSCSRRSARTWTSPSTWIARSTACASSSPPTKASSGGRPFISPDERIVASGHLMRAGT